MRYVQLAVVAALILVGACVDSGGDKAPTGPLPLDPVPPTVEIVSGDTVVSIFYNPETFWLHATDDVGLDSVRVDWGDLASESWRYWSRSFEGHQTDLTFGVSAPSYGAAGTTVIEFTVTDKEGAESAVSHALRIFDPPPTVQVIRKDDVSEPGHVFSADSVETGTHYRFVYEFYDLGGFRDEAPIEIQWGDGSADTVDTGGSSGGRWLSSHPYAESATREITVYVTDNSDQTTEASHTVVVYEQQTPLYDSGSVDSGSSRER